MIETPMFEGEAVCLTAIDPDTDAQQIAAWSQDLDIARLLGEGQTRPLSAFEARKVLEGMQKETEETGTLFVFGLHSKVEDRMIGLLRLYRINWSHAAGRINVMIGERDDRITAAAGALALGLRYAFQELNLFRLTYETPEYDYDQIDRLEEAGFVLETRLREFLYRADRAWDQLNFGILQAEWQSIQTEAQS